MCPYWYFLNIEDRDRKLCLFIGLSLLSLLSLSKKQIMQKLYRMSFVKRFLSLLDSYLKFIAISKIDRDNRDDRDRLIKTTSFICIFGQAKKTDRDKDNVISNRSV